MHGYRVTVQPTLALSHEGNLHLPLASAKEIQVMPFL